MMTRAASKPWSATEMGALYRLILLDLGNTDIAGKLYEEGNARWPRRSDQDIAVRKSSWFGWSQTDRDTNFARATVRFSEAHPFWQQEGVPPRDYPTGPFPAATKAAERKRVSRRAIRKRSEGRQLALESESEDDLDNELTELRKKTGSPKVAGNYSAEVKRAAIRRMLSGEKVVAIAEDLGVTKSAIYRWQQSGQFAGSLAPPKRTRQTRDYRPSFSVEVKEAAVARVEQGEPTEVVAKDIGSSPSAISYWLRDGRFRSDERKPKRKPKPDVAALAIVVKDAPAAATTVILRVAGIPDIVLPMPEDVGTIINRLRGSS